MLGAGRLSKANYRWSQVMIEAINVEYLGRFHSQPSIATCPEHDPQKQTRKNRIGGLMHRQIDG